MKTSSAAFIAGTAILLPALAVSAQPAPPASGQASTTAQTASGTQNSAAASQESAAPSQKCAVSAKSTAAEQEHDPSALPGKDTGWTPPKRKPKTSASPSCDSQPQ